jgi:hypothetical protein
MGMFDYIRVEVPLPDQPINAEVDREKEYQTKDLENLLETYTITADGRLLRTQYDYEWTEDPSHFLGGGLYQIPGSKKVTEVPFHGDVRFYAGMKNNVFREYVARFTEGQLARIWYEDRVIPRSTE